MKVTRRVGEIGEGWLTRGGIMVEVREYREGIGGRASGSGLCCYYVLESDLEIKKITESTTKAEVVKALQEKNRCRLQDYPWLVCVCVSIYTGCPILIFGLRFFKSYES